MSLSNRPWKPASGHGNGVRTASDSPIETDGRKSRVILLDTNALLWLDAGHRRARALSRWGGRLHVSPTNLLEIQVLLEAARIRLRRNATIEGLAVDDRWTVDGGRSPSVPWFDEARAVTWTRDPFDRLLVAHARYRSWRLATADGPLREGLADSDVLEI